jgi:molybdate transport system substrate-binding protein
MPAAPSDLIAPGAPSAASPVTAPRRRLLVRLAAAAAVGVLPARVRAQAPAGLIVAAASDLRFALDELAAGFRTTRPGLQIDIVYGSSGKLATQIRNGAPFDVFLSADIAFARDLHADGHAAGPPRLYAIGRLVAWSADPALGRLPLAELVRHERVRRFAIANPEHAPYGQRAVEALRSQGLYDAAAPKLVLGDNVSQAAQFIETGAAQAGLIAYSLVLAPNLAGRGAWAQVPEAWHRPLEQALIVTRRAATRPLAAEFVAHLETPAARALLRRYGFALPGEGPRS